MNTKVLAGFVGVAVVVGVVGLFFPKISTVQLEGFKGQVVSEVREIVSNVKLGAIPGDSLDSASRSWTVNGVRHYYYNAQFQRSSTTVCTFQTPPATTTLLKASLRVSSTTAATTYWEIGKSTLSDATTTSLGYAILGSSAQGTIIASTTSGDFSTGQATVDAPYVFAPLNWIVFKGGVTTTPTYTPLGECNAEFFEN